QRTPCAQAGPSRASLDTAAVGRSQAGAISRSAEGATPTDPDMWPQLGRLGMMRRALSTGAPVIPVGQWGVHQTLPKGDKLPNVFPRRTSTIRIGTESDLDWIRQLDHPLPK